MGIRKYHEIEKTLIFTNRELGFLSRALGEAVAAYSYAVKTPDNRYERTVGKRFKKLLEKVDEVLYGKEKNKSARS